MQQIVESVKNKKIWICYVVNKVKNKKKNRDKNQKKSEFQPFDYCFSMYKTPPLEIKTTEMDFDGSMTTTTTVKKTTKEERELFRTDAIFNDGFYLKQIRK